MLDANARKTSAETENFTYINQEEIENIEAECQCENLTIIEKFKGAVIEIF